jgi:short-subunit dehydrogenase
MNSNSATEFGLPRGAALITGASSGAGAEFARRLAAAGYDLVLTARREDKLRELGDALAATYGVRADVVAADLAQADDIARLEGVIAARDDLVLLVNNAGFGTRGYFAEIDVGPQLDMISVHVLASVRLSRAALPQMIGRGAGAIINVSSIASFFASPGGATYGASKAYLNTFSEALQGELKDTGVVVQALCPGFFYSGFHDTAEYENFDRSEVPAALWMPAEAIVAESLAALGKGKVIVVPGRQYKLLAATARSSLGGPVRAVGRRVAAYVRRNLR